VVETSGSGSPATAGVPWAALSDMAPRGRAVLVLRYYAGLHPAEIAAVLGRSVGTVRAVLDGAGDEAGHRQRLAALAVTIEVTPGWEDIRARVDAPSAPARRRVVVAPSRLGRLAGAAAAVVLSAGVLIARQDGAGVETADEARSSTTTTERRARPATSTQTATTGVGPAPVAAPDALLATVPPTGGVPSPDLPRMLDLLGLRAEDVTGGDDEDAQGEEPVALRVPVPDPAPTLEPSTLPDPPPADTPPTAAPLVHVRTPEPPAQGPDGWTVAQATTYGFAGWFILTYHVADDVFSFAEWIVDEYAEPVAVDTVEFLLRPGQNCLVTGAASDPYPLGVVPYRFVAGVVRADAVRVDPVGGVSGLGPDVDVEQNGAATIGPEEVVPGLRTWMSTVPFDYLRVEVQDAQGTVLHTASEADPDAFPDTC
jgi:DNA-binding CsgD family transcriptional regulator